MQDVAGVVGELVTSGTMLTINIFDESDIQGFSASALIVAGSV
jgi:hypothetical protein